MSSGKTVNSKVLNQFNEKSLEEVLAKVSSQNYLKTFILTSFLFYQQFVIDVQFGADNDDHTFRKKCELDLKDLLEKVSHSYIKTNDERRDVDRTRFRKKCFIVGGVVLATAGVGIAIYIFGIPLCVTNAAVSLFTTLRTFMTFMARLCVTQLKLLINRPDLILEIIQKVPISGKSSVFIQSILVLLLHRYITENSDTKSLQVI